MPGVLRGIGLFWGGVRSAMTPLTGAYPNPSPVTFVASTVPAPVSGTKLPSTMILPGPMSPWSLSWFRLLMVSPRPGEVQAGRLAAELRIPAHAPLVAVRVALADHLEAVVVEQAGELAGRLEDPGRHVEQVELPARHVDVGVDLDGPVRPLDVQCAVADVPVGGARRLVDRLGAEALDDVRAVEVVDERAEFLGALAARQLGGVDEGLFLVPAVARVPDAGEAHGVHGAVDAEVVVARGGGRRGQPARDAGHPEGVVAVAED